jgi:hypothetical protein
LTRRVKQRYAAPAPQSLVQIRKLVVVEPVLRNKNKSLGNRRTPIAPGLEEDGMSLTVVSSDD